MANITRLDGCCGIRELYNLSDGSEHIILQVAEAIRNGYDAAFYLFADNYDNRNGWRLARYITKHKLGKLTETKSTFNPNSNNKMKVWLWKIDQRAIFKFEDRVEGEYNHS